MILPGLPEEQILAELVSDRKIVANKAKKIATKKITQMMKSGLDGVDRLELIPTIVTTESLHNRWYVSVIINMAENPKWYHEATCCVESDFGTRDYYLIRGNKEKKPYFIKISSHAMKRFSERELAKNLHCETNFDSGELSPLIIRKGEIISWMIVANQKLLKQALACEDRSKFNILFYTFYGCYMGYETPQRNYVFKTFLNHSNNLKTSDERITWQMCKIAHIGMNEKLYDKDFREIYFNQTFHLHKDTNDILYDFKDKYRLLP